MYVHVSITGDCIIFRNITLSRFLKQCGIKSGAYYDKYRCMVLEISDGGEEFSSMAEQLPDLSYHSYFISYYNYTSYLLLLNYIYMRTCLYTVKLK